MIALSTSISTTLQKATVSGATPGVVPSLATFLDLLAPVVDVALPNGDPRHETTAPGKELPDQDTDGAIDPSLLFIAPPVLPEVMRPVTFSSPSPSGEGLGWGLSGSASLDKIALAFNAGSGPSGSQPDLAQTGRSSFSGELQGGDAPSAPSPAEMPHANPVSGRSGSQPDLNRAGHGSPETPEGERLESPFAEAVALDPASSLNAGATRAAKDGPAKSADIPPVRPEASAASFLPSPPIGTAARVFAQAIHRAITSEDPRAHRAADPIAITVAATTDIAAHAVTATGDAQRAPLDLTQRDWPGAMIERIEALRDAANAADTSIRLIPDALGTIDVKLHTKGETVHVHFAAEQAQTRAILAEAQPRLTELADARGLKLSQSGVDSGPGQQQRQPPPQPAPSMTPRRAREDADITDHRTA